jgi:hypothetical protein
VHSNKLDPSPFALLPIHPVHAKYTKDAAMRATCLAWADKQLAYMLGLKGSDRWAGIHACFFLRYGGVLVWGIRT